MPRTDKIAGTRKTGQKRMKTILIGVVGRTNPAKSFRDREKIALSNGFIEVKGGPIYAGMKSRIERYMIWALLCSAA